MAHSAERPTARFHLRECSIRRKLRGFSTSSRGRWKVGANGASDRVLLDIQCAASDTERKIFRRGSTANQSTLKSLDRELMPSLSRPAFR
jgi:hypothetical protein